MESGTKFWRKINGKEKRSPSHQKHPFPMFGPYAIIWPDRSYQGIGLIVYDLKSVGALEIKFVAPIPEQIATTTMHFPEVPGELF